MKYSHSQIHQEIRNIIDAGLDQPLDAETQAALDRHLAECDECRRYAARLHTLEAHLGGSLEQRWPAAPLGDKQRAAILGNILSHSRRTPMQNRISSTVRVLAFGLLALLLILALGWGIRTLRPTSPAGGGGTPAAPSAPVVSTPTGDSYSTTPKQTKTTPAEAVPPVPTDTVPLATPAGGVEPSPSTGEATAAPTEAVSNEPSFAGKAAEYPKVQFTFNAEIPAAPDQITLYQQQVSAPVTADLARQAAARLGVEGQVVEYPGEAGGTMYEVHGSGSVVRFLGYADAFVYEVIADNAQPDPVLLPPFEQQVSIAEEFLRQKGLLEGAYRAEPVESDPGVVRFVQLLDEREVGYGVGVNRMGGRPQWIDVSLTASGAVRTVIYNAHHFQSAGQYPILSAQQAWNRFSENAAGNYGIYAILEAKRPSTYRSWQRDYPVGLVHIYDYAVSLPSSGGGAPVVQFSRYPLSGAYQNMPAGKFLHAWGQIVLDEAGNKTFKVEGWELSTLADSNVSGTIDIKGYIHTDTGKLYKVSYPPEGVPVENGETVNIRGVILNEVLDWSYIATGEIPGYYGYTLTCGGGGGGGGMEIPDANFGGGSLANLTLANNLSSPAQPVPPYKAGEPLNGQAGTVWVTIEKFADRIEIKPAMWVETGDGTTFVAFLSGPGLGGIEQFNALPIKVWGNVSRVSGSEMYFTVDRFEEAYPGLRIQAWIGKEEAVKLEDKDVLLFTSLDGQQYVLKSSIGYGVEVRVGRPGDTVIREGVLIPDMTFGGYGVMQDLAGSMANGQTDLSGYTIMSNQPSEIDHTQEVPVVSPASVLEGNVRIDQVDLVYLGYSLAGCPASGGFGSNATYIQPAWRFRGTFEDGRQFEVLVQALTDYDLTFGMPGG